MGAPFGGRSAASAKMGFPFAGYYYAETQKEINDTVCRLNSLVLRISNARTGMLYASVMSDDPVMVNININLE